MIEFASGHKIRTNILDFGFPVIYNTKSGTFERVPRQVMIPTLEAVNWPKIRCQFVFSYDTDIGVTGEVELFDYTDFVPVALTQEAIAEVSNWTPYKSAVYNITPGHAYSLRFRRTAGTGNSFIYIEAAALIIL